MRKVIAGLIAGGLLIALGSNTAYSHEREGRNAKVIMRNGPAISVNLPSLGIRVNYSGNCRSVWIPGHWQRASYCRNVWIPGHFEKRTAYYPQRNHNGYCRR
ncbi:MAG: hypothetical protein PHP17_04710 [Candidatus Omnitrophica bacterium]|nr:hypothetical protein [Candidatus Omnitrophota bacterium]